MVFKRLSVIKPEKKVTVNKRYYSLKSVKKIIKKNTNEMLDIFSITDINKLQNTWIGLYLKYKVKLIQTENVLKK